MKNISVIGGGSAGWITALMVKTQYPEYNVTVIESPSIGILGAGEGTTPHFVTRFLDKVGIPASDLIKECKATIKHGIRFTNWNGDGTSYFHGFDTSSDSTYFTKHIESRQISKSEPLTDLSLPNLASLKNKVTFSYKSNISTLFENPLASFDSYSAWALHFDARLLADFLKKVALSRGVHLVEGEVVSVSLEDTGNINKLLFKTNSEINTDFVFDCSGFSRLILGKLYNVEWVSYSKHLPMKAAVPFFMPHDNDVRPETDSIAMKYGWVWKIPVNGRYGCGYVYDSDYINKEQAVAEAEEYFGIALDTSREFKFDPGTYKSTLIKNCMAVGLSQSFVEPLEATSIYVSLINLTDFLQNDGLNCTTEAFTKQFNINCLDRNTEVLEFIYMHYLTNRKDSDFWKDFKFKNEMVPGVMDAIDIINHNPYSKLLNRDLFQNTSWVSVCSDLGLLDSSKYKDIINRIGIDIDGQITSSIKKNNANIVSKCISHKDLINNIIQAYT